MIGGLIVGMTSVGAGSLMIILLLFTYPLLSAGQLVGTDLTQAVPLTGAAALGALAFGHVEFGVTASVIVGSVPAVLIGSLLSSRAPDRYIRPAITFVIFASGLKYVGLGTTALGWTLAAVLVVAAGYGLVRNTFARNVQGDAVPEIAAADPVDDLQVRLNLAGRPRPRAYSGLRDRNVAGGTVRPAARRHRGPRLQERRDQAHGRRDAGRWAEHHPQRAGGRRRRHHRGHAGVHRRPC
jgi:hypothetical protein